MALGFESRRSLLRNAMSAMRDETDLRFCAFADAAFARSCGVGTVAVQRTSPNQTLKTLSGAKSEHGPSL